MKKIYVKPEMATQQIELQRIMAGSPTPSVWTDTPADPLNPVLGRHGSVWGDDDDFDDLLGF